MCDTNTAPPHPACNVFLRHSADVAVYSYQAKKCGNVSNQAPVLVEPLTMVTHLQETTNVWDQTKAMEAIVYLANRLHNPSIMPIFKLLYFADKLHLSRYGRLITKDRYVAMTNGPVPSQTYDVVKNIRQGLGTGSFDVAEDGRTVHVFRSADLQEFSQSDLECLDEILKVYGHMTVSQLRHLSHDQAWHNVTDCGRRFEDVSAPNAYPITMDDIVATLPNADEVRRHLFEHNDMP